MSGMRAWEIQIFFLGKKLFTSIGDFIMPPSGENGEFTEAIKKVLSWMVES